MTETNRENEWSPVYNDGAHAYLEGKTEENNPYGKGQMMKRHAWFGGWHDKRRENTNDYNR